MNKNVKTGVYVIFLDKITLGSFRNIWYGYSETYNYSCID